MTRLHKIVFPAAGMGTRFLPATKATPKEMLTIVDKPLIQYGVEEALAAGLCPYAQQPSPTMFNYAPPDQRFPAPFAGGEAVTLRGFFPNLNDTAVSFQLPRLQLEAHLSLEGALQPVALVCDTVIVDTELSTVSLVWRGAIPWRRSEAKTGWVLLHDAAAEREESA